MDILKRLQQKTLFIMKIKIHFPLFCLFLIFGYLACTPKTAKVVEDTTDKTTTTVTAATTETAPPKANKPLTTKANETFSKALPVDPAIRIGTLDNGLKYYIKKNTKPENRAELRLAVNAGAMQEDDDQQGLAHFVEHMAFNGSTNFKKSELVDYLETVGTRFGPDLNAYTSFDETVYMLQVRTDSAALLDKGMLVLEDWAGGVSFENEEIDKERGVVESEWRSRLSPNQRMLNQWLPVLYNDSRYAQRLPIGKPEIIRNADYATVKRFYNDWYRPNLMAVVVVGDIDVDAMEKDIKERFGKLKNPVNNRPVEAYPVPNHDETLVSIVSDKEAPFTNVQLVYKHKYVPVTDLVGYRKNLVHRLYNTMLSDRLNEISQQPNPPFSFAYTGYDGDVGSLATYSSYAMVPEGGAARGLEVIMTENERVLRHGFTGTELERAKKELLTKMEKAFKEKDKTDSRRFAMRYVYNHLDNNPIPSIKDEVKFYNQYLPTIQLKEVNGLAKKWITDKNRVVVITGPEKADSPLPEETEIRSLLTKVQDKDITAYLDEVNDEPLLSEKLMAKPVTSTKEISEIEATEITLANGVKVVLKPTDFKNDEVLLRAFSSGGNSLYNDQDYKQASNAARIISASGVGSFDNMQLTKKMSGKVVRLNPWIGNLRQGFRGSASPDDLKTMLEMIYLFATKPRKDKEVLNSYVAKQTAIYKNLLSQPDYYFFDQTLKIKYNNHPRAGFPTAEDMAALNMDRIFQIYQERFSDMSGMTFFLVGNFDQEKTIPMLAKYLGNLPTTNKGETWKNPNINYQKGVVKKTLTYGEAPKALVDITFHGDFDWTPENRYHFKSMIDILKIKMRESMREDKGGVYGVRVSGNTAQYPESKYNITVSFNADPPRVDELIETAMTDIKNAQLNGAEEKDMNKIKETQRQGRIKELKENSFWINSLENAYVENLDPTGISLVGLEAGINSLTGDHIKMAANKYFDWNNYIQIVLLPETKTMETETSGKR